MEGRMEDRAWYGMVNHGTSGQRSEGKITLERETMTDDEYDARTDLILD